MIDKWCSQNSFEFPTFTALIQLADLFGCDIDYLFGRIEGKTHEIDDIAKLTGLSYDVVEKLINDKSNSDLKLKSIIDYVILNDDLRSAILFYCRNKNANTHFLDINDDSVEVIKHYDSYNVQGTLPFDDSNPPTINNVPIDSNNPPTINNVPIDSAIIDSASIKRVQDSLDKLADEIKKDGCPLLKS